METHGSTAKTALVLSGSGAYGAYEVGVIKALYAGNSPATRFTALDADVFAGTSMGGFSAAVMAMDTGGAHESVARLEHIWTEEVADNGDGRDPFHRLVTRAIVPQALRDSRKELHVFATSWFNGEAQEFDFTHTKIDEDMWGGIEASAAIPGICPMVRVGDEDFVDGGLVLNTPTESAVESGATALHVIGVHPDRSARLTSSSPHNVEAFVLAYLARLPGISEDVATTIAATVRSASWINEPLEIDERVASGDTITIHRYVPKQALGGVLDFDRVSIDRLIKLGYEEALVHDCVANECVVP